jgi:hypothetical protein
MSVLPRAAATATTVGYGDFSYCDVNAVQTPTEDKAQSKLWVSEGSAQLSRFSYDPASHTYSLDLVAADNTSDVYVTHSVQEGPPQRGDRRQRRIVSCSAR